MLYYYIIIPSQLLDPKEENKQFHVIANDLQESLNALWNKLPLDTVSATILDPRFKFYDKIPKKEVTEAIESLKKVFFELIISKF
jgi:hypothetical protein